MWTMQDNEMALAQGWGLFEAGDGLELQYHQNGGGEGPTFTTDEAVWVHVFDRADAGDPFCIKALDVLRRESVREFALIARYIAIHRSRRLAA